MNFPPHSVVPKHIIGPSGEGEEEGHKYVPLCLSTPSQECPPKEEWNMMALSLPEFWIDQEPSTTTTKSEKDFFPLHLFSFGNDNDSLCTVTSQH